MRRIGLRRRHAANWVAAALILGGAAICVAQVASAPDDAAALERTITWQKVASGELLTPEARERIEHQVQSLSIGEMLDLTGVYEAEIRNALDHAENQRLVAYRSRDIIRMTCIEENLAQMRTIIGIVEPRFSNIFRIKSNDLVARGHFSMILQAKERVEALSAHIETCLGDVLDRVSMGRITEESGPPNSAVDPTRPPTPGTVVDRPPEASTYQ